MRHLKRLAELIKSPSEGVVEHIISVFGNQDDGGDVVYPGAFKKTLQENGPKGADRIRASWQHDIWEPIGKPLEMEEVGRGDLTGKILDRAPGATGGLRVVTQISMTQRGRDAYTLLKDGVLNEWSIGYWPVKWTWDETVDPPLRGLQEVRLIEYALVTLAMNVGALTTGVKAVVSYQDLPLGSEDESWDDAAALSRVKEWAGGADDIEKMDWDKFKSAHVLWDKQNPEQMGSYKLLIADIVNGKLTAMPRGIFAAAVALQGGRSPIREFDDGDVEGAKKHLSRYYDRLDRTAPWDRDKSLAVEGLVESVLSKAKPTKPVDLNLFTHDLLRIQTPGAQDVWLEQVEQFASAWAQNSTMLKEGRVLSAANIELVGAAITQMKEAIDALQALLDAAKPPEQRALTTAREILQRRLNLQLFEIESFCN